MPEYLISSREERPKYAKIAANGKSLTWATQAEASGFGSPTAARSAFNDACREIMASAERRVRAALANGSLVKTPGSHGRSGIFVMAGKRSEQALSFFAPHWLLKHWGDGTLPSIYFPDASRPADDDLLGVFEQFFIHSTEGWLCRSQTKRQAGGLEWNAAFGLAVPFFSEEAALGEILKRYGGAWIVKTSCVFTGISPSPTRPPAPDGISRAIAAACEARDIRASLDESVQARLDAMKDPAAPRKRARL